jgi:hypothetical protein
MVGIWSLKPMMPTLIISKKERRKILRIKLLKEREVKQSKDFSLLFEMRTKMKKTIKRR